jgi:ABC-type transporter Mla subunit MlaD
MTAQQSTGRGNVSGMDTEAAREVSQRMGQQAGQIGGMVSGLGPVFDGLQGGGSDLERLKADFSTLLGGAMQAAESLTTQADRLTLAAQRQDETSA